MPRLVASDGLQLAYDRRGDGPALVLLHGSLLSRAIWRGLGYLAPLAQHHTVLRVDLRGHGRSGAPHDAAAYTQDRFVADLLTLLDEEGLGTAAVLGYSLGARIALSAALAAPERISRIVSLAGSAAGQRGAIDQIFFPGALETLRTDGMEAFCNRQGLTADTPDPRDQATREVFLRADPLAMAALLAATGATTAVPDQRLATCTTPALWMAGEQDSPRYEDSRHAAGVMPNGRFIGLPGRDHGATLSPAGPVLEAVLPFLTATEVPA